VLTDFRVIILVHQIRHIRSSVRGRRFWAGKKLESIEEEPEEGINVLDTKTDIEIPEKDMEKIKEKTNRDEDEILDKAIELDTGNPDEIIEALKEETYEE
jgi:hypothetical protein